MATMKIDELLIRYSYDIIGGLNTAAGAVTVAHAIVI
jgi:hypothetical protein